MEKVYFSLTSKGYKSLSIILSMALLLFFVVLVVNFREISLYAIIFVFLTFLFALFGCILCFTHMITINIKGRTICAADLIGKEALLKELIAIRVNNQLSIKPEKFCRIEIVLTKNRFIRISGYASILGKDDVKKTIEIIERINELLERIN